MSKCQNNSCIRISYHCFYLFSFLRDHGGPGLQHIGFSTESIIKTMKNFTKNGAFFRKPPPTYYTLEGKAEEIQATGEDPKTFQELGILIDPFVEDEEDLVDHYLLQIFSFPIFGANTFFLEIIQRQGSKGFGGGNIRALAMSIVELEKQQQERITQTKKKLTRRPSRPILKTYSQNDFGSLYTLKTKQFNRSVTKHTFDLEATNAFIRLQKLKMETEIMSNSMALCMTDEKIIRRPSFF